MISASPERYQLKTLHEDISLHDRKIAHLQNFETFETEALRDAAIRKLHTKRETLVQKVRTMTANGVGFLPSEVPSSLRAESDLRTRLEQKNTNVVAIDSHVA